MRVDLVPPAQILLADPETARQFGKVAIRSLDIIVHFLGKVGSLGHLDFGPLRLVVLANPRRHGGPGV